MYQQGYWTDYPDVIYIDEFLKRTAYSTFSEYAQLNLMRIYKLKLTAHYIIFFLLEWSRYDPV